MFANVIEASTPEVFDLLVFPDHNPATLRYLQNQFQNISTSLSESSRKFMEDTRALYERFHDSSVERAARAAIRIAKNLVNPNAIQRLETLEDIQSASPLMQRYIMTEPYIREKYHRQLCSGYAGTYIDTDPSFLREWHYDWRRVNNGVIRFEGEGDNEQWISSTFFEELKEGDRELSFDEQIDILSTVHIARLFAEAGKDPTCPFGGEMG